MQQWLEKMNWKMERFMRGRNGQDSLCMSLYVIALALILLSVLLPVRLFSLLALAAMGYSIFRCYSRNLEKRRAENEKWLRLTAPVRRKLALTRDKWDDRKTHRYFACPKCRETMRVPKGKGTIMITCRKCGEHFQRKT